MHMRAVIFIASLFDLSFGPLSELFHYHGHTDDILKVKLKQENLLFF